MSITQVTGFPCRIQMNMKLKYLVTGIGRCGTKIGITCGHIYNNFILCLNEEETEIEKTARYIVEWTAEQNIKNLIHNH